MIGFILVLVGLSSVGLGTILVARILDAWIDREYARLQAPRRAEFYGDPLMMPWEADDDG